MGKEGASNLVSLLSESLKPVVDMHNNDCVVCSCGRSALLGKKAVLISGTFHAINIPAG